MNLPFKQYPRLCLKFRINVDPYNKSEMMFFVVALCSELVYANTAFAKCKMTMNIIGSPRSESKYESIQICINPNTNFTHKNDFLLVRLNSNADKIPFISLIQ